MMDKLKVGAYRGPNRLQVSARYEKEHILHLPATPMIHGFKS